MGLFYKVFHHYTEFQAVKLEIAFSEVEGNITLDLSFLALKKGRAKIESIIPVHALNY
jgi:hypothetical protein